MKIATKKLKELVPADYNPRKDLQPGDPEYERLKKSIKRWGLVEPIVWNKRSDAVVGGHQRLKILQAEGEKETEVVVVDLSEGEERALNLALNKISGSWDYSKLMLILDEMMICPPDELGPFDLEMTGFSLEDIAEIEAKTKKGQAKEDDFNAEEEARKIKEAKTKLGDLYLLGEHRLLCGDATKEENIMRLMGGGKAEMVFTDPPYNSLTSWNKKLGKKESRLNPEKWFGQDNLTPENYQTFLNKLIAIETKICQGTFYHCIDWRVYHQLREALLINNHHLKHLIVWDKVHYGLGWKYRLQHELITYSLLTEEAPFYGGNDQSDVWSIKRTTEGLHSTQKPVELPFRAILNSAGPNGVIADLFAGSGTTLIAAEQLGRRAYLMEIDPVYCDVIVKRWEKFTGKKAKLLEGGDA